jgi:hypothetical protein
MARRNFEQLIGAVVRRDFTPEEDIVTEIKEWINEGYMRIADEDLSCFEKDESFNTVIGQHEYTREDILPSFRKMISVYSPEGPIEFQNITRFDYVIYGNPETLQDTPQYCYSFADKFGLFPIPDKVLAITARYYYIPDRMVELTDTHILPENKEELLVWYARIAYHERERDFEAIENIENKFERELFKWTVKDQDKIKAPTRMIALEREYKRSLPRRARGRF